MAYTKVQWRNNQSPPINADNLNHIEEGIYEAHQTMAENIQNIESLTTQTGANTSAIALEKTQRQQADTTETLAREASDNNLQSQINQIIAPSGEAPSAAEVQNARIAASVMGGETYDTLGNAIRGQVTGLQSEINDVKDTLEYQNVMIIHGYHDDLSLTSTAQTAPYILPNNYYNCANKLISAFRLNVVDTGKLSIGYIAKNDSFVDNTYDSSLVTIVEECTITQTGLQIVQLKHPFVVPDDCSLLISLPTDTVSWKYGYEYPETVNTRFIYVEYGDDNIYHQSYSGTLGIDFFTYKGVNIENLILPFNGVFDNSLGTGETLLISGSDSGNTNTSNTYNYPYIIEQSTEGTIIRYIKVDVKQPGILSIGYMSMIPTVGDTDQYLENYVITNKILLFNEGINTVELSNPFVIPKGGCLAIGYNTDTCTWYYGSATVHDRGFKYYSVDNSEWGYITSSLGFDVIGYPYLDYKDIYDDYPQLKDTVDFLSDNIMETITLYNGYSTDNHSISGSGSSPFMVIPTDVGYVASIKLGISQTGTLSIGTIKRSDAVYGSTLDFTKLNIHETFTINTLGEQTIQLAEQMFVDSDDYIVLNIRSDTAKFYYGSHGQDTSFYYVNGTTVVSSSNSLGVTFTARSIKYQSDSVYKNKTLSILGDSISTFSGYIPEGNATYYPSGTVQAVTDTWWYKLYTALGMTLNVNNSWSGSRVTTTAGETSAGCMTRCQSLGTNPDVIIVWMGINDFNNEVALGTYDGTTALPSVTTTFREAYAIMLNKILTTYQSSEVWVCTLPQCERNAETGFPEINGNGVALAEFNKAILELANAFGVKVLDHNKCGLTYQNMPTFNPDNLHPNKYGHSLVANNDIRQMDNFVRTRYPIQ